MTLPESTISRIAEYLSLSFSLDTDAPDGSKATRADFVRANQLALHLQMEVPPEIWSLILNGVVGRSTGSRFETTRKVREYLGIEGTIPLAEMVWHWPDINKPIDKSVVN